LLTASPKDSNGKSNHHVVVNIPNSNFCTIPPLTFPKKHFFVNGSNISHSRKKTRRRNLEHWLPLSHPHPGYSRHARNTNNSARRINQRSRHKRLRLKRLPQTSVQKGRGSSPPEHRLKMARQSDGNWNPSWARRDLCRRDRRDRNDMLPGRSWRYGLVSR
jgi:hypothetical protein